MYLVESSTNGMEWLSGRLQRTLLHIQTVWLFICNDIISMIIPTMSFVVTSAHVKSLTRSPPPQGSRYFVSLMAATLWTSNNLFLFCLHNQRQPAAIEEDRLNKPWRPLPSKRVSRDRINLILLIGYLTSLAFSAQVGGLAESVILALLTYIYNECGGGNSSLLRNLLNAGGVVLYYSGALKVFVTRSGQNTDVQDETLCIWLGIIGAIIFTTIHLQDLRDQEGDAKRGRRTMPLVYGDLACRTSLIIALAFWSFMVPFFWQVTIAGYIVPLIFGVYLMQRITLIRTADGDNRTFKLWSLWVVLLLLTPVAKEWNSTLLLM